MLHQPVRRDLFGVADHNREIFDDAGIFAVNVIGGVGTGKTTLIQRTADRLLLKLRIGVVACDPQFGADADQAARSAAQAIHVQTGIGALMDAAQLRDAIGRLDLHGLDLLLIESVSSIVGAAARDLGEHAKAVVFSVTDGDDKTAKYTDAVRSASVLLLNKLDLAEIFGFDRVRFRRDLHRLNPDAPVLEVSALRELGLDAWIDWLRQRSPRVVRPGPAGQASHWFG